MSLDGYGLARLRTLEIKLKEHHLVISPSGNMIQLDQKKGRTIGKFATLDEVFYFVLGYEWGLAHAWEKEIGT